ncbi:hypothetical protein [Nocardioides sp. InS609-2]|uniref:hypothetical protein n=1 Tax=Nocardioides sp. InS609-2 TaxID=2760705 RepID=UPI0020BF4159|nr:hypothetical protein [Nocardioides sp. InS609-2]
MGGVNLCFVRRSTGDAPPSLVMPALTGSLLPRIILGIQYECPPNDLGWMRPMGQAAEAC